MKNLTTQHRLLVAGIAIAALMAIGGPDARLSILTHDSADPHPHKVEASISIGKTVLGLLFTWTASAR